MKTNLQKLRIAAGFRSANAFADHIEINRGTYTNYEQGKRELTLERAWFFADIFGVTLDEFAGRDFRPESVYADPRQAELNRCWETISEQRRDGLLGVAQDLAIAQETG